MSYQIQFADYDFFEDVLTDSGAPLEVQTISEARFECSSRSTDIVRYRYIDTDNCGRIEPTQQLADLLEPYTPSEKLMICKTAWDVCCDGSALPDIDYDPWDGHHEEQREEIEFDAVTASLPYPRYIIISGEGDGEGTIEAHDVLTVDDLRRAVKREACGGDRWATAWELYDTSHGEDMLTYIELDGSDMRSIALDDIEQ
jgi:hypothetical protein